MQTYLCKSIGNIEIPDDLNLNSKQQVFDFILNSSSLQRRHLLVEENFKRIFPNLYAQYQQYFLFKEDIKFLRKIWCFLNDVTDLSKVYFGTEATAFLDIHLLDFVPDDVDRLDKKSVFNFMLSDNHYAQCGYFSKEKGFKIYFPELYKDFQSFPFPEFTSKWKFSQKLYHFLQDDVEFKIGLCKVCGKKHCIFENFLQGYHTYCSLQCSGISEERLSNIRKTSFERYGVENPLQSKTVREKIKATNLERYGVESPLQSKEIQEKWKQTNLKKYGCEYNVASEHCRNKTKETNLERYGVESVFQADEVKEKIKATNLERYGVESPLQSKEIQEKWKKTNLEKYGFEYSINSPQCKDKVIQTNLERYGVENVFQAEEIKEKCKATCLEKYGVEFSAQSEEIKEKCRQTNLERYGSEYFFNTDEYKEKTRQTNLEKYGVENYSQTTEFAKMHRKPVECDELTFDSSWEVVVYEYCKSHNLDFEYQPNIRLEYTHEGKTHSYQPDFLIEGKLYEVKGDHFFDGDKMINPYDRSKDGLAEAKHQCMKDNGVIILRGEDIEKLKREDD